MPYPHVIVWIDHQRATIIDFSIDDHHVVHLASEHPVQLHRKSGPMGSGRAPEDHRFFDEVSDAIASAREVLITGPGTAKVAYRADLVRRRPRLAAKVVGTESLDHPSDAQLLDIARRSFRRIDALRGDG